jgi:signal transduction histidine kinase
VGSLRVRLLLLMLFVLVATGSLAAWLAAGAIKQRFEQYVVSRQQASEVRRDLLETMLPAILADRYQVSGSWAEVIETVEHFAELTDERIIVTDLAGMVIVDTVDDFAQAADADSASDTLPLMAGGQILGALRIPPSPQVRNTASERAFINQVNRSLLIAVSVAGLLAVVLTLALSHGILSRVQALTTAVRAMSNGDLNQRVQNGADDEIGQLAYAFNSMADSLAHIEQLRRNMVSDVAHELRTPLSNIRGYLEAIQDGIVQPSPEVVASLYEEAILLHRLINDLQELAVAEAGQLRLSRQRVAISEVVDRSVQAVQGRVNGAYAITKRLTPDLPELYIDAERIGQVLRNLLNNAVEYAPPGGAIEVGGRQVNGEVQVNVYNQGEGIPAEHLPNVFERFYRVDDSRARATGGSGLGLAIVKQLVEAHGGRVWVESVPGQYANFIFTLPVDPL